MAKRANMRGVIALLLAFCVVLGMMPLEAFADSADTKMCFYGGAVTAAPGEIVEFPVFVKNNQGMSSTKIFLNSASPKNVDAVQASNGYSLLVEPGSVLASGSILTNTVEEGYLVLWFSAGNAKENGELFTMKFKVADDAKEGTYRIKLSYSKPDTANVDGENLDVLMEAGTITVKKNGSVSGSGSGSSSAGGTTGGVVVPDDSETSDKEDIDKEAADKEAADDDDKNKESFINDVKATKIKLTSKRATLKGKKAIKLTWKLTGDSGITKDDLDGFMVHRSTKKSKGYGVKPYKVVKGKMTYTNSKELKKGKTYYFKVRGYVEIDGKKYYTKWSTKSWRTIK